MNFMAGVAMAAALIWFAAGQGAARLFVGALLGMGAVFIMAAITIAVLDIQRQSMLSAKTVHMGSAR